MKTRKQSDYLVLPKEVETNFAPEFIKAWVSGFYKRQAIKLAKKLAKVNNRQYHVIEGGGQWIVLNRRAIKHQQKTGLIKKSLTFMQVNNLSVYTANPKQ